MYDRCHICDIYCTYVTYEICIRLILLIIQINLSYDCISSSILTFYFGHYPDVN